MIEFSYQFLVRILYIILIICLLLNFTGSLARQFDRLPENFIKIYFKIGQKINFLQFFKNESISTNF